MNSSDAILAVTVADIVTALSLIIAFISIRTEKDKKTRILRYCSVMTLVWLLIDIGSYRIDYRTCSAAVGLVVLELSYCMGMVMLNFFMDYCAAFISEKTRLHPWALRVPKIVLGLDLLALVIFVADCYKKIRAGVSFPKSGLETPLPIILLCALVILYIPALAFTKRKSLGLASMTLLGLYGIAPAVASAVAAPLSVNLTPVASAFSLIIVIILLNGRTLRESQREVAAKEERIHAIQTKVIIGVADLIENRDKSTGQHVKHTARLATRLAQEALDRGIYPEVIDRKFVEDLTLATPLHDVGKIAVSDLVLQKPGKLTDEEFAAMKQHAPKGGRIVRQLLEGITDEDYTQLAYDIANFHHEKWNGSGYPEGRAGEDIPVSARIAAIVDVYDALTAERVYKKAFPPEKALAIIEEDSGKHFDPVLGPLFVRMMLVSAGR